MLANIKLSSFTGKPDKTGFFQVLDFNPIEKERIIAILSVANKEVSLGSSIDNVFLGRSILTTLKNKYLNNNNEKTTIENVKRGVSEVSNEFRGFERFEISFILVKENAIYISCTGGASVYILRDDFLVPLVTSSGSEVKSASGYLKADDILLLTSSTFSNLYGKDKLKTFLYSKNLDDFTRNLNSDLQPGASASDFGVAAVKFENGEDSYEEDVRINSDANSAIEAHSINTSNLPQRGLNSKKLSLKNINNSLMGLLKKLTERRLYVVSEESPESYKKRKLLALTGAVLILILTGSIIYGVRQKKTADLRSSYEKELSAAEHAINEAENLFQLNPERARELFSEGRTKVLGLSDQGVDDPLLSELKNKLDSTQGKIMGEYETKVENFLDLNLLSDGFTGTEIAVSGNNLFVLDKEGKKISETLISTKRSEIAAGPNVLPEVKTFTSGGKALYVFTDEGVYDVLSEKTKVSEGVWTGEVLAQFYGGNLYVLEKSQSLIWRLASDGSVFGDSKSWLKEGVAADLSDANTMIVDGNIWIATSKAIYKFGGGSKVNFKLTGGDLGEFRITSIYTAEESEFLYILDQENGRVLVFTKDGEYKFQYGSEEIKKSARIAVFEKEKKLILLTRDKLMSVELKHI